MPIGRFGQAFLETLERNRPEQYRAKQAAGTLHAEAAEVDARARDDFETTLSELKRQHPVPENSDYSTSARHLSQLSRQAEELVMADVLVKDEETEQAETNGYQ